MRACSVRRNDKIYGAEHNISLYNAVSVEEIITIVFHR